MPSSSSEDKKVLIRLNSQTPRDIKEKYIGINDPEAGGGMLYRASDSPTSRAHLNPTLRSIIIGLGGNGTQMVNRIKKILIDKYDDYQNKVAFLAIDTDNSLSGLDGLKNLTNEERFHVEVAGSGNDRYRYPRNRDDFTKSWINPTFNADVQGNGAGQVRQACKAQLYDNGNAAMHNQVLLEDTIHKAEIRATTNMGHQDQFKVFVILGVAGGTGSGGIIDVAAMIKRTLRTPQYKMFGFFLMPDSVEQYFVGQHGSVYTNGYAALKELDYYVSAMQRHPNEIDYINTRCGPLEVDFGRHLYDMPVLVCGSNGIQVSDPNSAVKASIAEVMLNLIADSNLQGLRADSADANRFLADSFLVNVPKLREDQFNGLINKAGAETPNTFCEDSFGYSAIGVATASVPEKIVKSYAVEQIIRTVMGTQDNSGFVPADFNSFAGIPLTQTAAQTEMEKLLLTDSAICRNILDETKPEWSEAFAKLTAADIRAGKTASVLKDLRVSLMTADAISAIEKYLNDQYSNFLTSVKIFLDKYGPRAFAHMYNGTTGTPTFYKGIRVRLQELDNVHMKDGEELYHINVTMSSANLAAITNNVKRMVAGYLHVNQWHDAFKEHEHMKLAQAIAHHVFDQNGVLHTLYTNRVKEFCESCCDFADVLDMLAGAYHGLGSDFSDAEKFQRRAQDDPLNANIVNDAAGYNWAREIVDDCVRQANMADIKSAIIDSFMANPMGWTAYESELPNGVTPRSLFDTIMAGYVNMNNRLTVVQYMQHLATRGTNVANQIKSIIDNLYNKANVWYNQNPNYNALGVELSYIVVPSILVGDPAINAALINAYQNIPNIRVYQTNTDDKLVCYRLKGALPMYALRDMQKWQDAYESAARRMLHLNESGSGIYDPETGLAWEDYPALAMKNDVRLPDPATGRISREGLFIRDRLDPFFEEALKYGIIARKQNPNGEYYYECYCLCRLGWDYTVDLEDYQQFNPDRTYQTGTALLSYIASRNSSTLASITRPVALSGQGNFSQPVANPALALDMAKRSLRRDVIMYRDIKTTLSNLMPVLRAIDNRNTAIKQARVRLLLPKLIATSAVIRNEQNKWVMPGYPDPGTNMTLYNMSSANNLDNPIYNKELYYAVLAERFSEKMHNDEGISGYTNECWNRVVGDDQELTYSDCLANLNVFKEEASKFIADYCGEGKTGARRMLAGELCVDQEKLSVIIGDYQNLQRIINALSQ